MAAWLDWLFPRYPTPQPPAGLDHAKYGGAERRIASARPPGLPPIPTLTDVVAEPARPAAASFGAAPRPGMVSMGAEFDEALRRMSGGAGPAPAVGPSYPPNAGPQRAPGFGARILNTMPTLTNAASEVGGAMGRVGRAIAPAGGVLSRLLPGVGNVAVAGAEALDTADYALDPNASKIDVATRGAEGVSRVASMIAGTGMGMAAGATGGPFAPLTIPLGGIIGGGLGYVAPNAAFALRDAITGRNAAAPAVAAPPAVVGPDTGPDNWAPALNRPAPQLIEGVDRAAELDRSRMVAPVAMDRSVVQPRNSGWISTDGGAPVRVGSGLDDYDRLTNAYLSATPEARAAMASAVKPAGYGARGGSGSAIGDFVGATMGIKQVAGDAKAATARAKAAVEAVKVSAQAGKDTAEGQKANLAVRLAMGSMDPNATPEERAAFKTASTVLGMRGGAEDKFSVPALGVPTKLGDPTLVQNLRTGELEMKTPKVTANIKQGTDGKFYVTDAAGKAVREATAAEKARYQAAK